MTNFIKTNAWFVILILASFTVHARWLFFPIVTYGDTWFYHHETLMSFLNHFETSTWNGSTGIGAPIVETYYYIFYVFRGIFAHFNFDFQYSLFFIYLLPIIVFAPVGSFFLIKRIFHDKKLAFLGAVLYSFNTYFLGIETQHLTIAISYAFIPIFVLSILVLKESLESNNRDHLGAAFVYFVLAAGFQVMLEPRIVYILCFTLIGFAYYFFQSYRGVIALLVSALVVLLLSAVWILPLAKGGAGQVSVITSRPLFGGEFKSILHSITLSNPSWTGKEPVNFTLQPVPLYAWIIPIIAFIGLVSKHSRGKRLYLYSCAASLIAILLSVQNNVPFPDLYLWLFQHFPGFSLFRESSKFYVVIALGFSVLVPLSVQYIQLEVLGNSKTIRYLVYVLALMPFFFYAWPQLSGDIGSLYVARYVPNDYNIFKIYDLGDDSYGRSLWVPASSRWGIYDYKHPRIGYSDLLANLPQGFNPNQLDTQKYFLHSVSDEKHLKFIHSLFDLLSIRRVVVPIQDGKDDEDFFQFYGGRDNVKIRQFYIDKLDQTDWLERENIGTSELVVYKNPSAREQIFGFVNLYHLNSTGNLVDKFELVQKGLGDDLYFTTNIKAKDATVIRITDTFEGLGSNSLSAISVASSTEARNLSSNILFTNLANAPVYVDRRDGEIIFYRELGTFKAGNSEIAQRKINLMSVQIPDNDEIFITHREGLFNIGSSTISLGRVNGGSAVLASTSESLIRDGSFELGLWQDKVGDCNNFDSKGKVKMNVNMIERTDGNQSLELLSASHIACTTQSVSVTPGEYVLSFDYQSPNAREASYYISFGNADVMPFSKHVPIIDTKWHHYIEKISIPENVSTIDLTLYARSVDDVVEIVNRYDAVRLQKLNRFSSIDFSTTTSSYSQEGILRAGSNNIEYTDPHFSLINILQNGSFESGLWNKSVSDCNNYDDNPAIEANESFQASDGTKSLELSAARHAACENVNLSVRGGATYMLSFDYQSPNAKEASYYLAFNDASSTVYKQNIPIRDAQWHTFSQVIEAPYDASGFSLVLYAREQDGKTRVVNRYDNIRIVEVPNLESSYYLVSIPLTQFGLRVSLLQPKSITFETINPTKKVVHILDATSPFYLGYSESYHPQWKLMLNNTQIQGAPNGWSPFAKPDRVPDDYHFALDDFLNGWYVDPVTMCGTAGALKAGCTLNPDGSYNIEMVIEFWPQRWFYLGSIISLSTLALCLMYVGYRGVRYLLNSAA